MALQGLRAFMVLLLAFTVVFTFLHIMSMDRLANEPEIYFLETTTPEDRGPRVLRRPRVHKPGIERHLVLDPKQPEMTLNTSKCSVPNFDPFDKEMANFFRKKVKTCGTLGRPLLFKTNVSAPGQTCPYLDYDIAEKHYPRLDLNSLDCNYREVVRVESAPTPDTRFKNMRRKPFEVGSCPEEEHIWLECSDGSGQKVEQPLLLPKARPKRSSNNDSPFNVVVLGIDALSRLNFLRQLRETRRWLEGHYGVVEMFGYNKIGENSAPNQIPMITGTSYSPGLMDLAIGKHFDNLTDYIWDHYKRNGFTTMFFEEQCSMGLFVFPSMQGFRKAPTDYWVRPLMQRIDKSALKAAGNGVCIGGEFVDKLYLKYVEDALEVARGSNPLFSYAWFSELSHDDLGGAKRMDKDFLEFFKRIYAKGLLDETVMVFVADHGSRLEAWRATVIGRYEDMLPFLYVLVPPKLVRERPEIVNKLRVNSRRLVTVYDIHATLVELATPWAPDRQTTKGVGMSLISHEIPEDRTCVQSGIHLEFCSCLRPLRMLVSNEIARQFAQAVIDAANGEIEKNNAASRCVHWRLKKVMDIFQLEDPDKEYRIYKILLLAKPYDAMFEAAAQYQDGKFELISRVERLDWYSTNSRCVKDKTYERYCYCK